MITVENKVELFRKIVLDKIKKDFTQIKKDFDDKKAVETLIIEKEAKEKSEIFVEKFILKAEVTKEKAILDANKNSKEEILKTRNRIIDEVYQSVLDKCSVFLNEKNYFEFIENLIESVKNDTLSFDEINVYLVKNDFNENLDLFKSLFNNSFKEKEINFYESEIDFRGGFILYNKNKSVKLDVSLESIISRNKTFIGNEVNKVLDKDGESNE